MKKFDPYEILGVDPGAGDDEIKAAARAAHKRTHPDAGGDVDSFQRSRAAEMVLLDPEKRKKFDETGDVDDDMPDNDRGAALQIIEAFMAEIMQAFIAADFAPRRDPRKRNIIAEFCAKIEAELIELDRQPAKVDRGIEFLADMKERLTSKDAESPLRRSLDRRISEFRSQRVQLVKAAVVRRLAVEIASAHDFRFDAAAPEPDPYARFPESFVDAMARWQP